jgi:phenylalanyl-tRNA synthetase beta chain
VAGAGDLLEDARLVDIYEGQGVADGHRSLTFALRFRATARSRRPRRPKPSRPA